MGNTNGKGIWIAIFAAAAIAAFFVAKLFFPLIIEKIAALIVGFFALLAGLVFRKKRSS